MKLINTTIVFIVLLLSNLVTAQNTDQTIYAENTFEGTRVVVGHSVEMLREGDLDFLISHKFGRISDGAYEFFGLDQAIIRLGLDYAVKNWLTVGIGRSSQGKLVDGNIKYRLLRQQTGSKNVPITLTGLSVGTYTFLRALDPNEPLSAQNRLSYTHQLLAARQFGERISLQLAPTLTHYNLVDENTLNNDVISLGLAGKYQVGKSVAVKVEYYYTMAGQLAEGRKNSLALGLDLDTGSHVFQLHYSNSGGLIEPSFIGDTTGDFFKGDIHFGFTMSRIFRLKGRRY